MLAKCSVYEFGLDLRNLKFNVYSANPDVAKQIQSLRDNYI